MDKTITFNKSGYDPFIDCIKAYAIFCVLIGHTFPKHDYWGYGLWAGMQVPLFVLVQSFHVFKKDSPSFSFKKVLRRILFPFFLIQFIMLIIVLFKYLSADCYVLGVLKSFLRQGGWGPGSYYPWVYIQVAFLLPLIKRWIDGAAKWKIAFFFIFLCELLEIVSSVVNLPDPIYRLLAIRYFFLFFFGWVWVKEGIVINKTNIILSLISFLSIIYFEYFSVNDEILFYNTAWKIHRWPCYYYVSIGGIVLLYFIYNKLLNIKQINFSIRFIAKYSYEIFLMQMLVISFYPNNLMDSMIMHTGITGINSSCIGLLLKFLIISITCIIFGYYFNLYYNKFLYYHK